MLLHCYLKAYRATRDSISRATNHVALRASVYFSKYKRARYELSQQFLLRAGFEFQVHAQSVADCAVSDLDQMGLKTVLYCICGAIILLMFLTVQWKRKLVCVCVCMASYCDSSGAGITQNLFM